MDVLMPLEVGILNRKRVVVKNYLKTISITCLNIKNGILHDNNNNLLIQMEYNKSTHRIRYQNASKIYKNLIHMYMI